MRIQAITLHQPWATLVALGAKRIETRSWGTSYRGPLAIHAAKRLPPEGREIVLRPHLAGLPNRIGQVLREHGISLEDLPLGAVVAISTLEGVHYTGDGDSPEWVSNLVQARSDEIRFGNLGDSRYGWFLTGALLRLPEPVAAKGALAVWQWECPEHLWQYYQALVATREALAIASAMQRDADAILR